MIPISPSAGTVYLLHFNSSVSGKMQHYIGFAQRVSSRFQKHIAGESGAQFTDLAAKRGIGCVLAKTWDNVLPEFERKLKREKNLKRHCPICFEEKKETPQ